MSDAVLGSSTETAGAEPFSDLLDDFRRTRDELESGVLPLASSVDGRQFTFQASLHNLRLQTGGFVVLEVRDQKGSARS